MLRSLLNIASILCLVLCVALMGLWVRSYFYRYSLEIKTNSRLLSFDSERGILAYRHFYPKPFKDVGAMLNELSQNKGKTFESFPVDARDEFGIKENLMGFGFRRTNNDTQASLPISSLVVASAAISLLSVFPFSGRFSLRTLFFVTTFLAFVLGMIAWLDHAWIGK